MCSCAHVLMCSCRAPRIALERRRENLQLVATYLCTDSVSMMAANMKRRCDEAKHALLSSDIITTAWEASKATWSEHIQGSAAGYIVLALVLLVLGGKCWTCCFARKKSRFGASGGGGVHEHSKFV